MNKLLTKKEKIPDHIEIKMEDMREWNPGLNITNFTNTNYTGSSHVTLSPNGDWVCITSIKPLKGGCNSTYLQKSNKEWLSIDSDESGFIVKSTVFMGEVWSISTFNEEGEMIYHIDNLSEENYININITETEVKI